MKVWLLHMVLQRKSSKYRLPHPVGFFTFWTKFQPFFEKVNISLKIIKINKSIRSTNSLGHEDNLTSCRYPKINFTWATAAAVTQKYTVEVEVRTFYGVVQDWTSAHTFQFLIAVSLFPYGTTSLALATYWILTSCCITPILNKIFDP